MELLRTTSENPDFQALVRDLDAYLAFIDGEDHAFYHQFNTISALSHVLVAYVDGRAVACGAIKPYDTETVEVKRMYTLPSARGKGIGSSLLQGLENWAAELGYRFCILETGKKQEDAVWLYVKNGYTRIDNFGQYEGVDNSVCYKKPV